MSLNFDELENVNIEDCEVKIESLEPNCYVDLSQEILQPEILLSIGEHEYKNKFYPTPIMTAGEFSAVIAVSKAKKSFLKSAFLACYIGGKSNLLFGNIKSHRDKEYTILDFDTEMSAYYAQRAFRRVIEIVGDNYDDYKCYITRHLTSPQRLKLIDYCLKNQATL